MKRRAPPFSSGPGSDTELRVAGERFHNRSAAGRVSSPPLSGSEAGSTAPTSRAIRRLGGLCHRGGGDQVTSNVKEAKMQLLWLRRQRRDSISRARHVDNTGFAKAAEIVAGGPSSSAPTSRTASADSSSIAVEGYALRNRKRPGFPERSRLFEPFPNRGWLAVKHGQAQCPTQR
jgi:hypothetical protein